MPIALHLSDPDYWRIQTGAASACGVCVCEQASKQQRGDNKSSFHHKRLRSMHKLMLEHLPLPALICVNYAVSGKIVRNGRTGLWLAWITTHRDKLGHDGRQG